MRIERGGIVMTFPTERNGYQQAAVDARIKELELAIGQLQARLSDSAEQCARLEQDNRALQASSEAAARKEAAISAALVTIEQQRIEASSEMETQKAAAYREAERLLDAARSDAAEVMARAEAAALTTAEAARRAAEEAMADARAECQSQRERTEALEADYERRISQIRREIGALLELLPRPRQAGTVPAGMATSAMAAAAAEPFASMAQAA